MSPLVWFSTWLCRALSILGGLAVVLMMLHITLDVVLLNLFRISMDSTPDIVARYYMVAVAFLPLGWISLRGQMISVELVDMILPGWMRRLSDFTIALSGAAVYGLLTYATWLKALREMASGSFVDLVSFHLPIWQSHFIVPMGFGLATLASGLMALALLSKTARAQIEALAEDDAA